MNRNSGYTLIELLIATSVVLTLLLGVAAVQKNAKILKEASKASSIAFDVSNGIHRTLRLKKSDGCLTGISISHSDLVTAGVPQSSVYPTPWITNFSFGYRGSEPTLIIVSIDTRNPSLANEIYSDSKADNINGGLLEFQFPIKSPRNSPFSEMYRNGSTCWEHGVGAK